MKQFYKITRNTESKPSRLIASIVLAFIVMVFVNGFIGGMGGFPTFIAFVVLFFWQRTLIGDGNQITHQIAMTSRREVLHLLITYSIGYLVLWGILRLGYLISRVTGWGNINGGSVITYLQNLLGTSMLEKWAYLLAGVWMFAFVVSLFPLVVIRERMSWILYALVDGAVFALLCTGMGRICDLFSDAGTHKRASCLIDHLLLCEMNGTQELVFMIGMIALTIVIIGFSGWYAGKCYGPRRGKTDAKTICEVEIQAAKGVGAGPRRKHTFVVGAVSVAAVLVVLVIILFMPEDSAQGYRKVAEFLTEDSTLGPMLYQNELYVPVNENLNLDEVGKPLGYLAERDQDCSTRFYQLAVANLLYEDMSGRSSRLQMQGASSGVYAPMEEVEERQAWKQDEVFLLWDEDWVSESAYTHEPTGYTACNRDFIEGLEMQFPQTYYKVSDFDDYDAYFTISAYPDMETALEDGMSPGNWVGCILVKNNKFYYDSYENQITGISLQQLLDILGGS